MFTSLKTVVGRVSSDRGFRTEEYRPFPDMARRNWKQQRLEIPAMIWALKLPRGARVLEVGCGRGRGLTGLSKLLAPSRLVGLDINGEFLAEAEQALRDESLRAELYQGDVRSLPFANESFDLVIDFGTCYHIAFPARALTEIYRVLTSDGFFVHETVVSQLLSHPVRSLGRAMPLYRPRT